MEKQVIYEISETTQQVINGLMENISILNQRITDSELVRKNQQAHIVRLLEQLNPTHPVFGHKHDAWFDQTVSF